MDVLDVSALDAAWERYHERCKNYPAPDGRFSQAMSLLSGVPLSMAALKQHIIKAYAGRPTTYFELGLFASAGFQLLPERDIVYDLDTPNLYGVGAFLYGKRLVIDGSVGQSAGSCMRGELVLNGETDAYAGLQMIGLLINNSPSFASPGHLMIGEYRTSHRTFHGYGHVDMMPVSRRKNAPSKKGSRPSRDIPFSNTALLEQIIDGRFDPPENNDYPLQYDTLRKELRKQLGAR
jgi:hypothetical protein